MTPPPRRSTSPETILIALAMLGGLLAPRAAHAQACCVGSGLVTPARLRIYESYGVGTQTRVRSVIGSFDARGDYRGAQAGNNELDLEQDLFVAARFGPRFQAALQMPYVGTGERATGLTEWGGGLGDASANLRYDFLSAGERPRWPGIALLAGLSVPTGRPPDQSDADHPLGTSATGTGAYEGNLGLAVEQVSGQTFFSATGFVAHRFARTVNGITQSFAPRFTALIAGGYALRNRIALGAFGLGSWQGSAHDQTGATLPASQVSLVSAGLAVAAPLGDSWRLQGTAFADLPFPGWGRNQTTGAGMTISLLRVWL